MGEIKHTPGPWAATPKSGGEWEVDGDGWGVAIVCGGAGHEGENGRSDYNARLIAAAPELLEALKLLLSSAHDYQTGIAEAQEAIAKAEGRS